MLALFFYQPQKGLQEVVGSQASIIQLAFIMEHQKITFKVSNLSNYLTQDMVGVGDFEYWLNPSDSFSNQK